VLALHKEDLGFNLREKEKEEKKKYPQTSWI
jgi:hypothetical protein